MFAYEGMDVCASCVKHYWKSVFYVIFMRCPWFKVQWTWKLGRSDCLGIWRNKKGLCCLLFYMVLVRSYLFTSFSRFGLGVFASVFVCGERCGVIISSSTFKSICRAKYRTLCTAWMKKDTSYMLCYAMWYISISKNSHWTTSSVHRTQANTRNVKCKQSLVDW